MIATLLFALMVRNGQLGRPSYVFPIIATSAMCAFSVWQVLAGSMALWPIPYLWFGAEFAIPLAGIIWVIAILLNKADKEWEQTR